MRTSHTLSDSVTWEAATLSEPTTLLLVQSDPVIVDGNRRAILSKTLSGILAFCDRWPGDVVVSAPTVRARPSESLPLHVWLDQDDALFAILTGMAPEEAAKRCSPAVVLALHSAANYALLDAYARRTVFTFENGARQRLRIEMLQASASLSRARILVGHGRRLRAFRRSLRAAGGAQCNGYAAWDAAAGAARSAVLFFDHRVTERELRRAPDPRPASAGALRLGFSGRHIAIKGPHDALDVVAALRADGADVEMTMFGDGPLRGELQRRGVDGVTFTGDLDFETAWMPTVRRNIDLMVLPYPQGDPAGTYLESFALGVPVLGYANDAFAPLARKHEVGWAVPVGHSAELIAEGRRLLSAAEDIRARSENALDFARRHSMEHEFDVRVEHLRTVAQM